MAIERRSQGDSRDSNPLNDPNRDLGFGAVVARESRRRLLNRDGSFNVVRVGLDFFSSWSPYHYLLTVSWPRFLGLVVLGYLAVNATFGAIYYSLGSGALGGVEASGLGDRFSQAFFFSVQTFATIGYGQLTPVGMAANVVVSVESLVGLLGFALATGILFARFSRPTANILFSDQAVVAPYRGVTAFEFRIVNARRNQLIEVEAKLFLSLLRDGHSAREFFQLSLERDRVAFFPLSWTIVHPIGPESPLWGMRQEDLLVSEAEFFILLTGTDETFSQTVHSRSSYKAEEVEWGARFTSLFNPAKDGILSIDIGRLHSFEAAALPELPQPKPVPEPRWLGTETGPPDGN